MFIILLVIGFIIGSIFLWLSGTILGDWFDLDYMNAYAIGSVFGVAAGVVFGIIVNNVVSPVIGAVLAVIICLKWQRKVDREVDEDYEKRLKVAKEKSVSFVIEAKKAADEAADAAKRAAIIATTVTIASYVVAIAEKEAQSAAMSVKEAEFAANHAATTSYAHVAEKEVEKVRTATETAKLSARKAKEVLIKIEENINEYQKLEKLASFGIAQAQCELGFHYATEGEKGLAVDLYKKAAKQGHLNAQFLLGCCYEKGSGIEKDQAQAIFWFKKIIERGTIDSNNADVQYVLGKMYSTGKGVGEDIKYGVILLNKAATQGHEEARGMLEWLNSKNK